MVRSESVLLAALAALLGVAAGVGFAALAVAVFGRTGEISLVVPAGRVALVAGVALAAGLLAALLPARRVARLQVLDAISAR
jgi:putative ABC transport system permease protein